MKQGLKKFGFTLVEIMIVVALIGILSYLSISSVLKLRQLSRDTVICNKLRDLYKTTHWFYIENGRYPDDMQELVEARYFTGEIVQNKGDGDDPVVIFSGLEIGFDLDQFESGGVPRSPIPIPKVWAVSDDVSYGHGGSFGLWRCAARSKSPYEMRDSDPPVKVKQLKGFFVNYEAPYISENRDFVWEPE